MFAMNRCKDSPFGIWIGSNSNEDFVISSVELSLTLAVKENGISHAKKRNHSIRGSLIQSSNTVTITGMSREENPLCHSLLSLVARVVDLGMSAFTSLKRQSFLASQITQRIIPNLLRSLMLNWFHFLINHRETDNSMGSEGKIKN